MRFDLTVNILTNHAVNKGVITVFGGDQKRPNIHIDDVVELYVDAARSCPDEMIAGEIFNAGYQNHTVSELAEIAQAASSKRRFREKAPIRIETTPSNDLRSYHVSSRKIAEKLGWRPTADDRGRRARPVPRVQGGQVATTASTDDRLRQRQNGAEAGARNERRKRRRRRDRRGRLHRQPHGRPAARRGIPRPRHRQPGRRTARRISSIANAIRACRVDDARHPRSRVPDDPLFAGAEYVFHFAGIGDIVPSIDQPMEYMSRQRDGHGPRARSRAARRRPQVRLRGLVVLLRPGDGAAHHASDAAIRPEYPYALSKYRASRRCCTGAQVYKLPVNLASASSTPTAPRSQDHRRVRRGLRRVSGAEARGKPFTVVGDGTQRRDFLFRHRRGARLSAPRPRPNGPARSTTSARAIRNR